jgi:hypothetical protein
MPDPSTTEIQSTSGRSRHHTAEFSLSLDMQSRHRWKDNIKIDIKKLGVKMWTAFIWIRIWTSGDIS